MEFGDEIWWKITLKIHNRADVFSFVRSYDKLHSKILLISITLLIKQISPGVWTVFGCFHLGARAYIVIGSHITGLNPVWDSRWLDILCKFYFHRFGVFFVGPCFANESFWKYICDFIDLLMKYIIIQEGPTIWKRLFSTSRDLKNYVLHNCIESCLARWSCGFLPICKHEQTSTRGKWWLSENMLHRAPTLRSNRQSFVRFPRGLRHVDQCAIDSIYWGSGPGSPYINFKRVSAEGNILPALWIRVVCTTPAFWNWFLLFTYTVKLQEEIMRQLVCMKSCKFVKMSYLSFGAGSLLSPIPSPHASNGSAMFSPSNRTGGTPKSDIFDDRGLGHVGRVSFFFVLLETSSRTSCEGDLWSPTNIPKASRKVGPITSSKWAEMGSPKKIAYSGLEDFCSLATWATHWHPRSGTLT